MARKSNPILDILQTAPTIEDTNITKAKLPADKDIICYLAYRIEFPDRSHVKSHKIASLVTDQIIDIYKRANIPVIDTPNIIKYVVKLHERYLSVVKVPRGRREKDKQFLEFKEQLNKTSVLWPDNVMSLIKIEEDKQFLVNMMTTRTAYMLGEDYLFRKKQKSKQARVEATEKRTKEERKRNLEDICVNFDAEQIESDLDEGLYIPSDCEEPSATPTSKKHTRMIKNGQSVFIPHDILKNPQLVSSMARNKISPVAASSFLHSLISACGGDTHKFCLHETQALR